MAKSTMVPIYLEANSKDELVKKMFETNQKMGTWYDYRYIQKDGRKWVCWYNAPISIKSFTKEKVEENAN